MVRVIIEHKAKDTEKLAKVIGRVTTEAMKQHGYITGEFRVNTEDPTNVLVMSTWDKIEDWKAWDNSEAKTRIKPQIDNLLVEPYTVRTFDYCLVKENRVWSIF